MAFATDDELSAFIGADVPVQRAVLMLELASAAVVNAAGVPLTFTENDTVTLDGNGAQALLLPSWPVVDVTAVKVGGEALDDDSYRWSRTGELRRTSGRWPARPRAVEVTYSHGYRTEGDDADLPSEIKLVTLQVAARAVGNPQRLNSFGDGQVTAGYGGGGTGVQVLELYRSEEDLVRRSLR